MTSLFIFSSLLPAIRSMLDFNMFSVGRLLLIGAVVFAVLAAVVMIFSKEWRSKKGAAFFLAFILLAYAPSAVAQLNFDLDTSVPKVEQAVVNSKNVSHLHRGPNIYRVRLSLPDGRRVTLKVSLEDYYSIEKGDEIDVYIFDGAFDIPYVIWD